MKMQDSKQKLVMSLFPNALGFGYALMRSADTFVDGGVVAVKPRPVCNNKSLERIKEMIDYYRPDTLVLEDPGGGGSRKSTRIRKLIDKTATWAEDQGIDLYGYPRDAIRFVFSQFGAKSKFEIASVITGNIKALKNRMIPQRRAYDSENYYTGLFDAVALAITHFYISE